MSKYSKEDIIRLVREGDVEFIRMQFTDIFGQLKNVAITASQIEKAVNNQIMIDGSSIEGFVRIHESDQYLYPDLDSFTVLPWRPQHGKVARLICDVYNPDGTPFVGDPRGVLKRVLKKAADMGYSFNVGPECEFFLFQTDENGNPTTTTSDEAKLTLIPENTKNDNWVTVNSAPSITKQPVDATVAKGGTASFTLEATGTAPLHYQWYGISDASSAISRTPRKVGTDSPTLLVTNAFSNYDKAIFYCVVSNDYGEAKSDAAQLVLKEETAVIEKPIIKREIKFADVAETAYYRDPVAWAVEKGITNGTSDTAFSPNNTCTRAQIITFLWRAAGSPEPKSACSFTDINAGAYYEKAVTWAAEQGMASGDKFGPNDPCTREMAVEFMWKQAGSPKAPAANFTDVSSDAVNWALEKGVTKGTSDTTFSPNNTCTRGQIVTFLWRAFGE